MNLDEKISFYVTRINQATNNTLSDWQKRAIFSALKLAEIEILGLRDNNKRCVRCYSDRGIGYVITITPANHITKSFDVCMNHIKSVEDYLEGKAKQFDKLKKEFDTRQTRFDFELEV